MPDTIALVGLSGSGKSSVGRMVAASLGRPFVDVDQRISAVGGGSPATIIGRDGEARFREIEAAEVRRAVAVPGAVIATGGGAVIDPLSRWALWDAGLSVWLDAPDAQLAKRLRRSDEQRPLVAGDAAGGARPAARRAGAVLRGSRCPDRIEGQRPVGGRRGHHGRRPDPARTPAACSMPACDATTRWALRMSHMVYGRDLDVATLGPLVADLSTGVPVVVADEARGRSAPGPHGGVPRRASAARRGR